MDEDFKSIHLAWIARNPKFVPQYGSDYSESYLDIMKQVYSNPNCSQAWAKKCFAADLLWKKKVDDVIMKFLSMNQTCSFHFITVGFNHQTWNIPDCVKLIETIMSYDWVVSCKAVFELHRANGEHPHAHFLIQSSLTKSKILEKMWAAKGIKKLVLKKSFIDYKVGQSHHELYVTGMKVDEKMIYVAMDNEWRDNNNIKHLFEKTT